MKITLEIGAFYFNSVRKMLKEFKEKYNIDFIEGPGILEKNFVVFGEDKYIYMIRDLIE